MWSLARSDVMMGGRRFIKYYSKISRVVADPLVSFDSSCRESVKTALAPVQSRLYSMLGALCSTRKTYRRTTILYRFHSQSTHVPCISLESFSRRRTAHQQDESHLSTCCYLACAAQAQCSYSYQTCYSRASWTCCCLVDSRNRIVAVAVCNLGHH